MGRLTQIMRAIDGLEFVEHVFKHDEELFHDSILVKLEPDWLWQSEFFMAGQYFNSVSSERL